MDDVCVWETSDQGTIYISSRVGGEFTGINCCISIFDFLTSNYKSSIFIFLSLSHTVAKTPSSSCSTTYSILILNTIGMEKHTNIPKRHHTLNASSTHIISIIIQTLGIGCIAFFLIE